MRDGVLVGAARRRRYSIVKEHLLRTKGGGAAGPLSIRYSTPAGGFGGKMRRFSALAGCLAEWASWAGGAGRFAGARAWGGAGEAWVRGREGGGGRRDVRWRYDGRPGGECSAIQAGIM